MYYIGLDVHKKTISYCVKDAAGHVHREGKIESTRRELDAWDPLPRPIQPLVAITEQEIITGVSGDQIPGERKFHLNVGHSCIFVRKRCGRLHEVLDERIDDLVP
jgi:hypothetical protein